MERKTLARDVFFKGDKIIFNYGFLTLDPRPAGKERNEEIFRTVRVYGIEVTVPALAERCVANLDPQHTGGDANRAAIEEALTAELPPAGIVLATIRADLDSVGAMAIFSLRLRGENLEPAKERICLVAESDKFARGGWPGRRALPTRDNPWPEQVSAESSRPLAAIAAAVSDFRVPLEERVALMERWLLTGEEPAEYREKVERERAEMISALESGVIKVREAAGGRIAVVESIHRAATSVGYCIAPVVVALNPEFRFQGGEPIRKFTVCQFEAGYVDLKSVFAELSELEPGWGGSPTIGGSPQGVNSRLAINQVVEVVERHLIR